MRSKSTLVLGALASSVVACSTFSGGSSCGEESATTSPSPHPSGASSAAAGGAGQGPPSDVRGTMVFDYVSESKVEHVPQAYSLTAFSPVPGGYVHLDAETKPDGSFLVHAAPAGLYALRIDDVSQKTFLVTSARELDLGGDLAGRYDADNLVAPAIMTFDLTGLDPWAVDDQLLLYSLGPRTVLDLAQGVYPPQEGDTTVTGLSVDSSSLGGSRIEGSKGDRVYVFQQQARFSSGQVYWTTTKVLEAAPFDQQDGVETHVSGALVDVPQQQIDVDVSQDAFYQSVLSATPSAALDGAEIYLNAVPGSRAVGGWPSTTIFGVPEFGGVSVSVGDPFPASWTRVAAFEAGFAVGILLPSGDPISAFARSTVVAPLGELTKQPVVPPISPATGLTIEGMDAHDAHTHVGESPLIAWSPPEFGHASAYVVLIYAFISTDPNVQFATILTTETSLRLPPGAVGVDNVYVWTVEAHTALDISAPFRLPFHDASATAVGGTFSP